MSLDIPCGTKTGPTHIFAWIFHMIWPNLIIFDTISNSLWQQTDITFTRFNCTTVGGATYNSMRVNVEIAKRSIKLYSSQMCTNCSRNAVYSHTSEKLFQNMFNMSFRWTIHFRRRRHSLILHDCLDFSCSTVSNSHHNTLAGEGLPTLHSLPGSSLDCMLATSHAG